MNRTRKTVVVIGVLLGLFLLAELDAAFGGLRFVSSRANEGVSFAALWLPAVCAILLTRLPRGRARLLSFAVLIPLAAFCVVGSVGDAAGEAAFPATVVRQSRVRVGYSQIVTCYSDAGVLDDGNVFVQQEIKLLPGVLWVWPILDEEGTAEVNIRAVDCHHIEYDYVADTVDSGDPSPNAKRGVAWVF